MGLKTTFEKATAQFSGQFFGWTTAKLERAHGRAPGEGLARLNLSGYYLRGVDLREADLREADLGSVDLREADLRGADLGGANLSGAKLHVARLQGVKGVTPEQLTRAQFDWYTKCVQEPDKLKQAPAAPTMNLAQVFAAKEATTMRALADEFAQTPDDVERIKASFEQGDQELEESLAAVVGRDEAANVVRKFRDLQGVTMSDGPG